MYESAPASRTGTRAGRRGSPRCSARARRRRPCSASPSDCHGRDLSVGSGVWPNICGKKPLAIASVPRAVPGPSPSPLTLSARSSPGPEIEAPTGPLQPRGRAARARRARRRPGRCACRSSFRRVTPPVHRGQRPRSTFSRYRCHVSIDPGVDIGHVHLKVSDIQRALDFYSGVLGFEEQARYGDQAVFLSAGGYHHHIGLNTWESLGRPRLRPVIRASTTPPSAIRAVPRSRSLCDAWSKRTFDSTARGPRRERGALPPGSGRERLRALP